SLSVQAREGGDPDQGSFELADVARDLAGDVLHDVVGDVEPLLCSFLPQDRDPGLKFRRLDVGQQAPLESVAEAILKGHQLLGWAVARDHDLLVGVMQGVERVEELFLRLLLVFQELNVVDEQDIDFAVAATETFGLAIADRVDEVVGELFGTDVTHAGAAETATAAAWANLLLAPITKVSNVYFGFSRAGSISRRPPSSRPVPKCERAG